MPKIWTESGNVHETPNRNNFDLSRQNHLTMKMGGLYPIMCEPVVPGDSFDIKAAFGLKFAPLVFPVQSHMRAHMHFFYVRNKNIWENWENFASNLETHERPYIEQPSSWFKTGTLADYLNVPTTQTGFPLGLVHNTSDSIDWFDRIDFGRNRRGDTIRGRVFDPGNVTIADDNSTTRTTSSMSPVPILLWPSPNKNWSSIVTNNQPGSGQTSRVMYFFNHPLSLVPDKDHDFVFVGQNLDFLPLYSVNGWTLCVWYCEPGSDFSSSSVLDYSVTKTFCPGSFSPLESTLNGMQQGRYRFVPDLSSDYEAFCDNILSLFNAGYRVFISLIAPDTFVSLVSAQNYLDKDSDPIHMFLNNEYFYTAKVPTVTDDSVKPFGSDCTDSQRIKINALPFRAYESIYNAYYRNTQNQPFYINGVEQFNRYNTTLADGADTTDYQIMFRNYELDYLTSCMPSPQQGIAPLVGMTALGNITITDENGVTTAQAEIDNDGTITNVVLTSPAASIDHARTAMNLAAAGMSINDFRSTNALQRWLEMNLRRGYKYLDFITGHFGQSPHYDSLDLPEFIGGFSQDVQVNMLSSTADTAGTGGMILGDYVGQANCFGASGHEIRKYCDDFGYIVGILCVVPTPAYTQLLPKDFLRSEPLDWYYPEFSQLGLQPITYKEVCPIQRYQEYVASSGASGLNTDTFGYQRPNYDLVGAVDQVHGEFRSTLKNYLINRIFAESPYLGTDFLEINPKEINDIFTVTDPDEDPIFGQVVLDVKAKRPIPRVVVPNLGK